MPLYRTPNFIEHSHPIPIAVRNHTDLEIDSIPITYIKHTTNGAMAYFSSANALTYADYK